MAPQFSPAQNRLANLRPCLAATWTTLDILSKSLNTPFLQVISNTTHSLLDCILKIKQNKDQCAELMEQTYQLLNAVVAIHLESNTSGELAPDVLGNLGQFTEVLHKIYAFIEAQQHGGKLKSFFRHGEMSMLLKECEAGLRSGFEFFQVKSMNLVADIANVQENSVKMHQEVLEMIEDLNSDGASSIGGPYSASQTSVTSISMLPPEPKIFYGRDTELDNVLAMFRQPESPRVAIIGAGGIGKTALSQVVLHHTEIADRFQHHRYFVACDSAGTAVELAALVGTHLGLKPGKDLTRAVVSYFSKSPPCVLVLDNFESVWEPTQARRAVEEFLSLLADIAHLALMVTMRGAERPAKLKWTRPFLAPLGPLAQSAARQIFLDIADDGHDPADVDAIVALTGNMPLAISLLAHLADSEGCAAVLSRWEIEKTSLTVEHFKHFDDPEFKCRFYNLLAFYYLEHKHNHLESMKYCQLTLELATPAGDTKAQSNALHRLAWIRWRIGEYAAARALASEAQRVSHISADLYREAQALQIGAICRTEVGDYAQGLAACIRARALLAACGMAGGDMEHALMASQAEVHKWKSEYEEARGIHVQVLEEASRTQNAYHHAYALVNLVEVDVLMGRPTDAIQQNLDKARGMFEAVGDAQAIKWADAMEGDLAFLQGDKMRARTLLQDGVRFAIGTNVEMALYCLDRLADVRRWGGSAINSSWPTVYLLQTLKVKNTLGIHRALQLLEDVFLAQGEIATAANLLSVALKAFTFMDVHRSRAQCMLRLGDIAHKDGDPRRALKLLEEARPLLKRSSQGKDAEDLEQRISAAVNPKV